MTKKITKTKKGSSNGEILGPCNPNDNWSSPNATSEVIEEMVLECQFTLKRRVSYRSDSHRV